MIIIIIISCPWTSVAVVTTESSSFNLDSNLRLFFRLSLSLLDLFLFVTGRGLLGLILVPLFVVIAFTFTRALHDALQHVRLDFLDDSSSSAVY